MGTRIELRQMEQAGQGGGPGPVCSPAQASKFIEDDKKLAALLERAHMLSAAEHNTARVAARTPQGTPRGAAYSTVSKRRPGTPRGEAAAAPAELRKVHAEIRTLKENIERNKTVVDRLSKMPLW